MSKKYVYRATCDTCGLQLTNENRAMYFRHLHQHSWTCQETPNMWHYENDHPEIIDGPEQLKIFLP